MIKTLKQAKAIQERRKQRGKNGLAVAVKRFCRANGFVCDGSVSLPE